MSRLQEFPHQATQTVGMNGGPRSLTYTPMAKRYLQQAGYTLYEILKKEAIDENEFLESLVEIPECCWLADCSQPDSHSPQREISPVLSDKHRKRKEGPGASDKKTREKKATTSVKKQATTTRVKKQPRSKKRLKQG